MKLQAFYIKSPYKFIFAIIQIGLLSSCQTFDRYSPPPSVLPATQNLPIETQSPTPSIQAPQIISYSSLTPTFPIPIKIQPCSPLENHTLQMLPQIISQPYDPPPIGSDARHQGVDFFYYQADGQGSIAGEGIQSILPGIVAAVINDRLPYGNMIIIETPVSFLTQRLLGAFRESSDLSIYHLYAHMASASDLSIGDSIPCGQLLGQVGQTGYNIPVPHLHLETRLGTPRVTFKDMAFYDTQATSSESENYLRWRTSGEFENFNPMLILAGN